MSHETAPTPAPEPTEPEVTAPAEDTAESTDLDAFYVQNSERQATLDKIVIPSAEDDKRDEESDRREHGQEQDEAQEVLHGVRFLNQLRHEAVDSTIRRGEKITHGVEDKKFSVKDYYYRHRVEGLNKKLERLETKSNTAVMAYRRRKYARKARALRRRIEGISGFYDRMDREYRKEAGISKEGSTLDAKGKPIVGEREVRRKQRREQLQSRINRMLKVESGLYEDISAGRALRGAMKHGERLAKDRESREKLRELIRQTSTTGGLESLGKGEFYKKLKDIPIIRDTIRDTLIRLGDTFEGSSGPDGRGIE